MKSSIQAVAVASILLSTTPLMAEILPITSLEAEEVSMDYYRLIEALGSRIQLPQTMSELENRAMRIFDQADVDGEPGFSKSDAEILELQQRAKTRAVLLQQWMSYDLDGDLVVTREELRPSAIAIANQPLRAAGVLIMPTEEQVELILEAAIAQKMKIDSDGDDRITIKDIDAEERRRGSNKSQRVFPQNLVTPEFDEDGDGVTTREEFTKAVKALLVRIDIDEDGKVSDVEARNAMRSARTNVRVQ